MKIFLKLTAITLFCLLLLSCSIESKIQKMSMSQRIEIGDEFYDNQKYSKAIPYYSNVVFEKKSSRTSEIQHRLGNCYKHKKDYESAVSTYEDLLNFFPDYAKKEDVLFLLGESYYQMSGSAHYTQDETYRAIDVFKLLLANYPNSKYGKKVEEYLAELDYKLIEKKYYNGYIYFKIYDYPASLLYLQEVIDKHTGDELELKSLYYCSLIYLEQGDMEKVDETYSQLLKIFPDAKQTQIIKEKYKKNES